MSKVLGSTLSQDDRPHGHLSYPARPLDNYLPLRLTESKKRQPFLSLWTGDGSLRREYTHRMYGLRQLVSEKATEIGAFPQDFAGLCKDGGVRGPALMDGWKQSLLVRNLLTIATISPAADKAAASRLPICGQSQNLCAFDPNLNDLRGALRRINGTPVARADLKRGWCPRSDSNRQALRRRILNPLRLPIPPLGHLANSFIRPAPPRQQGASIKAGRSRKCRNRRSGPIASRSGTSARADPMCHG